MFWTLKRVPAIGALALVLWKLFDGSLIYANAESVMNPVASKVVPIFVHGRELFITPDQALRLSALHWTNIVLLLLLVWIVVAKVVNKE